MSGSAPSVNAVIAWLAGAGWLATFGVLARTYIARMRAVREAASTAEEVTSKQWSRFEARIVTLENKVDELEREIEECRNEKQALREQLAEEKAKRIEMEAYNLGRGEARQEAAQIIAHERIEQKRAGA